MCLWRHTSLNKTFINPNPVKTLGARLSVELIERLQLEAFKRDKTQSELIQFLYDLFPEKMDDAELEKVRAEKLRYELDRAKYQLLKAQETEINKQEAEVKANAKKQVEEAKATSRTKRINASKLEAELVVTRATKEIEELQEKYDLSVATKPLKKRTKRAL